MEITAEREAGGAPLEPLAVTVPMAAKLVAMSRSALYELVARGDLPSARVGRRRLVLVEDLRAWLRAQRGAGA